MAESLHLDKIRIDGETQSRVKLNQGAVSEYAEALQDGAKMPPIDVFHDGSDYWLGDGFHRYHAHRTAGIGTIPVNVHTGTARDARLHAIGANATHGLQRTAADKRRAVEMLLDDEEWSSKSDRQIAEKAKVSTVRQEDHRRTGAEVGDRNGCRWSHLQGSRSLTTDTEGESGL